MLKEYLFYVGSLAANLILPPALCVSKFGNSLPWKFSLKDALNHAKLESRPVMVVIWMDGCPSCAELIPKMSSSDKLVKLAVEEFAVVALNEFKDDVRKFREDGGYTPRIYFLNPEGKVDLRFYNKWDPDPDLKFYYPTINSIVNSMKEVVEAYPDRCKPTRPCNVHGKAHGKTS